MQIPRQIRILTLWHNNKKYLNHVTVRDSTRHRVSNAVVIELEVREKFGLTEGWFDVWVQLEVSTEAFPSFHKYFMSDKGYFSSTPQLKRVTFKVKYTRKICTPPKKEPRAAVSRISAKYDTSMQQN